MVALAVWLVSTAIVGLAGIVALYAVVAVLLLPIVAVAAVLAVLLAPFQVALEGWRARRLRERLARAPRIVRPRYLPRSAGYVPYTLERRP